MPATHCLLTPRAAMTSRHRRRDNTMMSIVGPVRYSTSDWIDCIWTLPTSRILKRTRGYILSVTVWTALAVSLFKLKMITCTLPPSVHSVVGSAIGLLLVFRTNTSYDRFWEARKSLGLSIIACRDIAKLTFNHIGKEHHRRIAGILVAFSIAVKQHLQGDRDQKEFEPFLECSAMLTELSLKRNRPLYLLRELDAVVAKALTESYEQGGNGLSTRPKYMEKGLHDMMHELSKTLGVCERIVKQPAPLSYSRHTSRFLTLYLFSLPFCFASTLGWLTIPVVTSICWSLVSIQEIGHFIEEPFNKETQIIPMNQIISVIWYDVSEILNGVLDNPDSMERVEIMLRETISNSRQTNNVEHFFAYYSN